MRVLHTADWHLGHSLHQQSRHEEHALFLGWLSDVILGEEIDALLIAGDVFESANPPTQALRLYYETLTALRQACPELDIIVIGGNHDSAARLDAPGPLWEGLGVRVVGGLPRDAQGHLETDRLVIPIHRADGSVGARVLAVPFLRPADLPRLDLPAGTDPMIAGVEHIYEAVLAAARAQRAPDEALIAMGHCYMADTRLSENSERKVLGGNQHALTHHLFPADLAYVALGHLHFAQAVHGEHIRYSGSPIPLSMAEADYAHQVVIADFDGAALTRITPTLIPRSVDFLRLPVDGPAPVSEVLALLEAQPLLPDGHPRWQRPFLEVSVVLEAPDPTLRQRVEASLEGRMPRLVSLKIVHDRDVSSLADMTPKADLARLTPEAVLKLKWKQGAPGEPPAALLAAFSELVDAVGRQEDAD